MTTFKNPWAAGGDLFPDHVTEGIDRWFKNGGKDSSSNQVPIGDDAQCAQWLKEQITTLITNVQLLLSESENTNVNLLNEVHGTLTNQLKEKEINDCNKCCAIIVYIFASLPPPDPHFLEYFSSGTPDSIADSENTTGKQSFSFGSANQNIIVNVGYKREDECRCI